MKILGVIETDLLERGPHQTHHLMERLSQKGHNVRFIDYEIDWQRKPRKSYRSTPVLINDFTKATNKSRVTIIRPSIIYVLLFDYLSACFSYFKEIYLQITTFQPDVVVGFSILNALLGFILSRRAGIPFIYYLIDAQHTLVPLSVLRPFAKVIESYLAQHADKILVINDELGRYAQSLGASPQRIEVVRTGIDTTRFTPTTRGDRLRAKYGLQRNDFVLFFMGWMYRFSGLTEVASTLLNVQDQVPQLKLVILGKGDIYPELRALQQKGLTQLILIDWQPYETIPQHVALSDICILPAYNNAVMRHIVPIKMYEYMACGKPVIASNLPGIRQEFGDENGVIYVEKPEEVVETAITLMTEKQRLIDLGAKAAQLVQQYSWTRVTEQFETILLEVR